MAVLVFRSTERTGVHKFEEFLDRNRLELERMFVARERSDSLGLLNLSSSQMKAIVAIYGQEAHSRKKLLWQVVCE